MDVMRSATKIILATKNFKSFAKANDQPHDNVCLIFECEILDEVDMIVFRIKANRFLRNMVRALTGTLVELGKGKITLADFENIIVEQKRESAGLSAPAQGLFLVKINYKPEIFIL